MKIQSTSSTNISKKEYIGIFDSGVGGISVLKSLKKQMPTQSFCYFADSAYNPYGKKSVKLVQSRVQKISQYFVNQDISTIVIACNTATTIAIDFVRKQFPQVIFVGTEPGIKPAIKSTKTGNILVMATPLTLKSKRYQLLKSEIAGKINIFESPCPSLVPAVESCTSNVQLQQIIHDILDPFSECNIDTVVLSSTHFSLIKDQIQSLFPKYTYISPVERIAAQSKKQHPYPSNAFNVHVITTGKKELLHIQLKKYAPFLPISSLTAISL